MEKNAQYYFDLEARYGAHNYAPLKVAIAKGRGAKVWDVEGRQYLDFLSAYSALNQGHNHPRLVEALCKQAQTLSLTSRAFYNDKLGETERFMAELFGYDKVLMMNSGAEANETAIKLARKWAYTVKGVPDNEAVIVAAKRNFHGRTTTVISASSSPEAREGFGPFMPGFQIIDFDDLKALEDAVQHPNVCAFWVEPIQGEAGVFVPSAGYLKKAAEICKQNNVLFMADEIQTGLGRTGRMLACDHEGVRPDVLILGKALSGGMAPVSAVLADDQIMLCIQPGEHGSTFGGNPLAAVLAKEALQISIDESLAEKAEAVGRYLLPKLAELKQKSGLITAIRGKGALIAIDLNVEQYDVDAKTFCQKMMENGLLAKPSRKQTVRFAPPLVISEDELKEGFSIIAACVDYFSSGASASR